MTFADNQEKDQILRFHQFVLNNKSQDIRDELYEYIVSRVIYDHGHNNQILSKNRIVEYLEKDYTVTSIPPKVISSTLERLTNKNHIVIKQDSVELSANKIKEIRENNSKFIALIETVKKDLETQVITIEISNEKAREIVKEFFMLLAKTFSNCGKLATKIIADGHAPIDIFNNSEFKIDYQKSILQKVSVDQRDSLDSIFNSFFQNITEEKSKLFFTLVQAYALLQIFNVDPDLKKLQEASLNHKKIYLDTNILIGLFFEENNNHETIKTTLQITKQLGAQLFITTLTKVEFETWLESCERSYHNFKNFPKKFIDAFKQKNTNAPFFNTYHKRLRVNPRLSIREFCKYYENFLTLLENQYHVVLDTNTIQTLKDDDEFQDLLDYILHITPEKGKRVATHDALCIIYIKHQRTQFRSDEMGPNAWFLTTDTSLKRIERKIFSHEEFTSSIRYGVWLQIISPLLSPMLVDNNNVNQLFTKLISTNFSSNTITEEDVLNILSAFIDDTEITLETLKEIVGNTHIRETFRKLRKATLEHDVKEQKRLGEIGVSQVTKSLRVKHNTETINLKSALNNFSIRLAQQEKQMQEQNKIMQEQNKIMQEQSATLKQQTSEIKSLQKEKNEKKWGLQFLKKLLIGMAIAAVISVGLFYFKITPDIGSITGVLSIEATILGAIFATWYAVHKSRSTNS